MARNVAKVMALLALLLLAGTVVDAKRRDPDSHLETHGEDIPADEDVPVDLEAAISGGSHKSDTDTNSDHADMPAPKVHDLTDKELKRVRRRATRPKRPNWVAASESPNSAPTNSADGNSSRSLWVFGTDDRRPFYDLSYPWGTLCRIESSTGVYGSGVLIGPRHVLTASHVINWSNGWAKVDIGRSGSTVAATSYAAAVYAYTKISGTNIKDDHLDDDYAVIVLRDRLGDRFGWLGTKTYTKRWDYRPYWTSFGFPGDIGGGRTPTWQNGKWLDERASSFFGSLGFRDSTLKMKSDGDFIPGQSGSPMFAYWDGKPYAVAVWSAYTTSGSRINWCSGGSRMSQLVRWARDRYP